MQYIVSFFSALGSDLFFFFWLIIAACLLAIELGHPGLFLFMSFSLGAVGAAIVAFCAYSFFMQCIVFLMATIVSFQLLRRLISQEQKHTYRSNVYALQGETGIVCKQIMALECGQVKVCGQMWRAESVDKSVVPVDVEVRIVAVRGTRLIVEKI